MLRKVAIVLGMLILGATARGQTQTVRVAAAADLQFAMKDIGGQFEKKTGTKVAISYGSSGNFRAQIENGAPFDVFFSADSQYPQQLISSGAADGQSLIVYAIGHLVLWAPGTENLDVAKKGFDVLKDPRVTRIAIANPEHAPYGRAAVAALQKAGIYDLVKPKLVYGENISQTAQFVQSGSAQVGLIALSLTLADSMKGGDQWIIPSDLYPTMQQDAVIVTKSTNKTEAQAFLDFVKSDEGRKTLMKYGLTPPEVTAKP
jgi:molybdate transport system substrate-binding protein